MPGCVHCDGRVWVWHSGSFLCSGSPEWWASGWKTFRKLPVSGEWVAESSAFLPGVHIWEPYADADWFSPFDSVFTGHSNLNGPASRYCPLGSQKATGRLGPISQFVESRDAACGAPPPGARGQSRLGWAVWREREFKYVLAFSVLLLYA